MKRPSFFFLSFLLFSSLHSSITSAQSRAASPEPPAKPSPASPALAPAKTLLPTLPQSPSSDASDFSSDDIIKILRKAKSFSFLIRLLKTTQIINQINSQLITTKSGGLTILAPNDGAFSQLKAGFLNSLDDNQKIELLQSHVFSTYVSSSNFDSLTNHVRTLAEDSPTRLQLNVTAYGSSVNISTGVVNATITGVVYSDKQLAIYHVDKVLLPLDFFQPKPPALAPALAKAPKASKDESSEEDGVQTTKHNSVAVSVQGTSMVSVGVALVAVASMLS
ncbi:fasciclin-like arabinogalactan protein 12 [Prosopis cineraria]|uniref:fasciclin-like arabinogalactan protein 12 n=1 Tax=Prosopis cineraria TaxID=364024 RepID=UPI0024108317|nr:fasciclin-like arabinogalactan protein 12 [Prosopis cineraria]